MNGIKPDPDVKMDLDAHTPAGSGYMDDDFYEDTGELQLPPRGMGKDTWLTRIPDWIYEKVSKWDDLAEGNDDEQIVIGEVIAFPDEMGKGGISRTKPMRIFFDDRWRQKEQLPTAFELVPDSVRDEVLRNTYVFAEKDLPGYRPNGFGQGKHGASSSFGGVQDHKSRIQKRSRYKKAIPKQTALIGHATRQYRAQTLPTKEAVAHEAARNKKAIQGSNTRTNIVDNFNEQNEFDKVTNKFSGFVRPAVARKSQINKAARIPKNELIDLLHQLFDEYMYWPMKTLKQRTRQPEAYLKEVLGDIAQLVKSGPFASCWQRLQMYNRESANMKQEKPPDADVGDSGDDEEEMEDVV
ncbi:transcription initiation factor IIF [Trematosphaeria pertusa]|uniref:Transcription initiation factor IIF subunit beta n=1 Tax=Trematosphaeria pertusa TaxID=390896 RepID=A0A6A6IS90_9PLEO|nr:transcription initiation factor IIF [Trematosphaeria pertusa]KAF2253425.1 transcription initiation factor IIF [Trematosphaeria pertusa]